MIIKFVKQAQLLYAKFSSNPTCCLENVPHSLKATIESYFDGIGASDATSATSTMKYVKRPPPPSVQILNTDHLVSDLQQYCPEIANLIHYCVECLFFYPEGISSCGLRSTNNEYTRRSVVGKGKGILSFPLCSQVGSATGRLSSLNHCH